MKASEKKNGFVYQADPISDFPVCFQPSFLMYHGFICPKENSIYLQNLLGG
jgi:hypothetical protein